MIVVMPDGWSRWGCGQWVDSPVTGNYETYLLEDVIPTVDATYRTISTAPGRGVFGFSSGGFGGKHGLAASCQSRPTMFALAVVRPT